MKDELKEIRKKYADERRTEITTKTSDIEIEDLIAEEENVISITHSGYIKRLPVASYRKQRRGGRGVIGVNLKEDDFVEHLFISSTHHYIMFFSNLGKVYRLKVHELPEGSKTSKGKAIINLLSFKPGEKVTAIIATKDYKDDEYLIMATKKGIVKKTSIVEYDTSRKDGIVAIGLQKGDELIGVEKSSGNDDIIIVTKNGKAIRFNESDCRPMGRIAQGVKGIRLSRGDEVLSMSVVRDADADLLIITEKGYGKRTSLSEYSRQRRGGSGVKAIQITEKKGIVAGVGIVKDGYDVMVVSTEGILIRIPAKSISKSGRATQGVKIMNLQDGARVASFKYFILSRSSLCSFRTLSRSRAVNLWSLISRIACAWIAVSLNFFIKFSFAVGTSFDDLIVLITSSRLSRAISSPSKICALSSDFLSSNSVLFIITVNLCLTYSSINLNRFNVRGTPSTSASIIIPNVSSSWVFLYKRFTIILGSTSFLISITTLIPLLSDSSLKSVIPSIFLSLTSSTIFSISLDLFT